MRVVLLLLVVGGIGCAADRRPTRHVVRIEGFAYHPASLRVSPGDTVVWENADMVPHTATAVDRSFDSGSIPAGGSWRMVASSRGARDYLCTYHPTMKGALVVE